jgi:CRP/FNR family cyclic AMP-dependent transcriptional regulator
MAKVYVDGLLSTVPLFSRCTRKELTLLSGLTTKLTFPAGRVVARQGQVGREFIVIHRGKATVTIDGRTVATLGPGDFFGEIALLDGGPRTATVTADTDVVAEVMSHQELARLLVDVPTVTRGILKGVAARLRATDGILFPNPASSQPVDHWHAPTQPSPPDRTPTSVNRHFDRTVGASDRVFDGPQPGVEVEKYRHGRDAGGHVAHPPPLTPEQMDEVGW